MALIHETRMHNACEQHMHAVVTAALGCPHALYIYIYIKYMYMRATTQNYVCFPVTVVTAF